MSLPNMETPALTNLRDKLVAKFSLDELDEFKEYLNELRESGVTNMFASPAYLQRDFEMSKSDSNDVFSYWASTFQNYLKSEA